MSISFSEIIEINKDSSAMRRINVTWQGHTVTVAYKPGMLTPATGDAMRSMWATRQYDVYNRIYFENTVCEWDVMDGNKPYPLPMDAGGDGAVVQSIRAALETAGKPATLKAIVEALPDDICPAPEGVDEPSDDVGQLNAAVAQATEQRQQTTTKSREQQVADIITTLDAIRRLPTSFITAIADAVWEDTRPKAPTGQSFGPS